MSETLERPRTYRTTREMGPEGHVTYAWDAADDEWMLPLIRRKMEEGYVFWIIKREPLRETELRRVEDIGDQRHVVIRSQEARELFAQGRIALAAEDEGDGPEEVVTGRARTAEEAVAADTVSHRPMRGG